MMEHTDFVLSVKIADNFERLVAALEKIADKPPVVVATPRPQEPVSKNLPVTADGVRIRHPLDSGGWIVEVVNPNGGDPGLYLDRGDGIRIRLLPQ